MTIQCHLIKMKAELKETAKEIRNLKSKRKELKGWVPGLGNAQWKFRVNHIAYCLLRGRTIEQIESKTRNPGSYELDYVYKEANKIVDSVLNPKPPVIPIHAPTVEVKKESVWTKVLNSLS